jgi:uncharacterized protein
VSDTTPSATGALVGRVGGLRTFPVKSLDAPHVARARVLASGLEHDRGWAVVDGEGQVVTAKQVGPLREVLATVPDGDSTPSLELRGTDGRVTGPDAERALTAVVGRSVTLRAAGGEVAFNEVAPLHVVSRQSVERAAADEGTTLGDPACSIEQPRANIELDLDADLAADLETGWVGRELHLGEVVLHVSKQPRHCLGVYADVVRPGVIEVGDEVRLA